MAPPGARDQERADRELPPQHARLIVLVRPAEVRVVREHAAAAWTADIYDVRGRRLWQGRAASGQRTLAWRPGADGAAGAPAPGIYFARLREAGMNPVTLKIPWTSGR